MAKVTITLEDSDEEDFIDVTVAYEGGIDESSTAHQASVLLLEQLNEPQLKVYSEIED